MSEVQASEEFDKDFAADDRLFHYTGAPGLYGILEHGNLWATHFQFLNDSQEFFSAKKSLVEFFKKEIRIVLARLKVNQGLVPKPGVDVDAVCAEEAARIADLFYAATFGDEEHPQIALDAFVFSTFCCNPSSERARREFWDGTLLHWSTYGRSGGYAIQLNSHKIFQLFKEEERRFPGCPMLTGKAIYSESGAIPNILKQDFEIVGRYVQQLVEIMIAGQDPAKVSAKEAAGPIMRVVSLFKDSYFSHEAEARIVAFRPRTAIEAKARQNVEVRQSGSLAIPFIKLFDETLLKEHCPIERIIVGPHNDNRRRVLALKTYLRIKGLEFIDVSESNVPFIS